MLLACIAESTVEAALFQMEQARPFAGGYEIRIDYLEELSQLSRLVQKSDLPLVFTFRKREQGGRREIAEGKRLEIIEKLASYSPAYFDIEMDTDPAFIKRLSQKSKLIGSYHNFEETPQDLNAILVKNPHFSIIKIAVKANSTPDMLRLMAFARKAKFPLSAISMGEFGRPSRVLGPIVGNVFDYAGVKEEPLLHRYSLKELHEVFHYSKLNRDTEIFALLGDPIEHSEGHIYHNQFFEKKNRVYIKMRLKSEELAEAIPLISQLPFRGFSVTIPLKEAILPYVDEIENKEIGAVNTLLIKEGKIFGANTDGRGALNAIEKHFPVKGKQIALLGAGGSSRAIAFEAIKRGAKVSIFNRTAERAEKLAAAFGCQGYSLIELSKHSCDLLINTIPDAVPVTPSSAVMDIVIHPRETPFLLAAKDLLFDCIYGEEMWREQAVLQQDYWK